MKKVQFQFHNELNDFLHPRLKSKPFDYFFEGNQSAKHLIEANRIPHTEVGGLIVNGEIKDISYLVADGDQIEVYPSSIFQGGLFVCQEDCFEKPRFLLDNHLGKLAKYLRMLGFDTLYHNDYQDEELAHAIGLDQRILLTRDRGLLMRRAVVYGYCVRALDPEEQIIEVVRRYKLLKMMLPFQRCMLCNGELEKVDKQFILHHLEPLTKKYYNEFHRCISCKKLYWKGSHYERMMKFINKLVESETI